MTDTACLLGGPTVGLGSVESARDDTALTELYLTHYRPLVRLAYLLLGDAGASEEVVQDAYVKVHGAWGRVRDRDKAVAYLRATVVNLARSRLRHRKVEARHEPDAMLDAPSAESGAIRLLDRAAVRAALRELPVRQREAVVLRYYADLSESQIAAAMGVSNGAVKSHLSRGIATLRTRLEAER